MTEEKTIVKKKDLPVLSKEKNVVQRKDFIELKYTGYSNGEAFDSNVPEELKKINPKAEVKETIISVGQGMVVPGLDKALEGKEVGKDYSVEVSAKEGFGERKRELIRILSLRSFTEKKVDPQPGMVLALDNAIVKIIAVSGARVTTDFNNPLAGRDLVYKIKIVRKVTDDKEKSKAVFEMIFKFVPEFEVREKKIVIKGPAGLEEFVKAFGDKFKELVGKELGFEVVEGAKIGKEKTPPSGGDSGDEGGEVKAEESEEATEPSRGGDEKSKEDKVGGRSAITKKENKKKSEMKYGTTK